MLLPGIRELRVPLAAGLLWLVATWVIVGRYLPKPGSGSPLLVQVDGLIEWAGPAVTIAALAFLAYLVGVVAMPLSARRPKVSHSRIRGTSERQLLELTLRSLRNARSQGVWVSHVVEALPFLESEWNARPSEEDRYVEAQITAQEFPEGQRTSSDVMKAEDWSWIEKRASRITTEILNDLSLSELSLQQDNKDIFETYDRGRAEADFRGAVAWPIGAVACALAVRAFLDSGSSWSALWLVALLPAAQLFVSAITKHKQADDFMVQAILSGAASAPQLKLIESLAAGASRGRSA